MYRHWKLSAYSFFKVKTHEKGIWNTYIPGHIVQQQGNSAEGKKKNYYHVVHKKKKLNNLN